MSVPERIDVEREALKIANDCATFEHQQDCENRIVALVNRVRAEQREADAKAVCRYCRFRKYGKAHYDGDNWIHTGSKEYQTAVYCAAAAIRNAGEGEG